ncbi:MAG: hypothetical protein FJ178_06950 [Gammaproteobacteria bacterium]|nr:hypothetical protein [Gammaproteobacteria bacterium]
MRKKIPTRRGPKTVVSSEQLARFAHGFRIGDGTDKQPRRWESITRAANKKFGTNFLPAHLKRCYAKYRDELTSRTIKKIIREFRVTENLQRRLAENDERTDRLRLKDKERDYNLRRQRDLEEAQKRLRKAEERAASLRKENRRKYNRRFKNKGKRKTPIDTHR